MPNGDRRRRHDTEEQRRLEEQRHREGLNEQRRNTRWVICLGLVGLLIAIAAIVVPLEVSSGPAQHVVSAGEQTAPKGPPVVIQHVAATPFSGETFAFPQPLDVSRAQLMALGSTADQYISGWVGRNEDYPWAWKHGGAVVGAAVITLDVRGNRKAAVRIEDMRVVAQQCSSPATGTLFYSPSAGSAPVIRMGFNLDQEHPIAQLLTGGNTFGGPYFVLQNTITLGYGEQQQIQLLAATKKQYCEFRIDMSVLDGSSIIPQMIDNGGQPFRVTAAITAPDPGDLSTTTIKYAAYQRLYVGGVAPGSCDGWARANPLIYGRQGTNAVTC